MDVGWGVEGLERGGEKKGRTMRGKEGRQLDFLYFLVPAYSVAWLLVWCNLISLCRNVELGCCAGAEMAVWAKNCTSQLTANRTDAPQYRLNSLKGSEQTNLEVCFFPLLCYCSSILSLLSNY